MYEGYGRVYEKDMVALSSSRKLHFREDLRVLGILLVYSFVLMLFISTDSYLYDLYYHIDSPSFFMAGKAWMSGMVPYVDFADSKGPLLWVIYGLGYLISHHSYVGVFWISILFIAGTLFFGYKLCRLFADEEESALATVALPFLLLCFQFEIKSEDFCYPFVMISLYSTSRVLKDRRLEAMTYFKMSLLLGISCMCCGLIKFNVGCMIMSLMAVVLYMATTNGAGLWSCWGMGTGLIIPAIPFCISFLLYGNMREFIQEYLLNTFATVANKQDSYPLVMLLYLLLYIPGLIYFSKKNKLGYWLVASFIVFLVGIGLHPYAHYFRILTPFFIFFFLSSVHLVISRVKVIRSHVAATCIVIAVGIIASNTIWFIGRKYFIRGNDEARKNYYTAAYVISQIKDAKVMNETIEMGFGVPSGSLPEGKYWIGQSGMTEEMRRERSKDLEERIPDFVFVGPGNEAFRKEVERCGYELYCHGPMHYYSIDAYSIYGRPGLEMPPEGFRVSQWDVWLKRDIFGI